MEPGKLEYISPMEKIINITSSSVGRINILYALTSLGNIYVGDWDSGRFRWVKGDLPEFLPE